MSVKKCIVNVCDSTVIFSILLILIDTQLWGHPTPTSNFSSEDYKLWEYLSNGTMQLKQPFHTSIDHIAQCPDPQPSRSVDNCESSSCTSDENCTDTGQICCFNGCVYTCQNHLPPAPALDWIIDRSNISSLNSTEEGAWLGSLTCSTTVHSLPALIRGCPEGFKCHVYEAEDPILGIPNKGICISEDTPEKDTGSMLSASSQELIYLSGGCLLTTMQYKDIEGFLKGGHYASCKCDDGYVMCKVNYNNSTFISNSQDKSSQIPLES